jgi:hypothetical protein
MAMRAAVRQWHLLYVKQRIKADDPPSRDEVEKMIELPIDVATRVTPGLSALLERLVNDPERDEAPTLGDARHYFTGLMPPEFNETERMHRFDVGESLLDELNALIAEFGEGMPAVDFVRASASEALTRVIETVVNDENRENPASLGDIRAAMAGGLIARLVGEGVMDEDEDDTLLAEVDSLIQQYGEEEIAENVLRYD